MTKKLLENLFCTKNYVAALGGVGLVILGTLVLFKNSLAPSQEFHWWAMFLLLPAFFLWGCAWLAAHWRVPYRVSLGLFGLGFVILTVAAIFLLDLLWTRWWPLMLITPALTVFLIGLPSSSLVSRPESAAWVSLAAWVGFTAILLGVTFLVGNFGLIDLKRLTEHVGWWGSFIALCTVGAAFNGIWLWMKMGEFSLSVMGLGLTAIVLLIIAIFEWFRLDWWLWGYWLAIVSGMGLFLSAFMSSQKRSDEDANSLEPGRNHHTTH